MKFEYRNHRGETEIRNVTLLAICYFEDPSKVSSFLQVYPPGFFLECIAHDRGNQLRHFAIQQIKRIDDGKLNTFRLPVPSSKSTLWGIPYYGADRTHYAAGYATGRAQEDYSFARARQEGAAAYTHGYNDGWRSLVEGGPALSDLPEDLPGNNHYSGRPD